MKQGKLIAAILTLVKLTISSLKGYSTGNETPCSAGKVSMRNTPVPPCYFFLFYFVRIKCQTIIKMSVYLWLFLLFFPNPGLAQINDDQKGKQIEEVIESIAESTAEEIDNSSLLEDLTTNAEHPLNINLASEEELTRLSVLDFNQIQNIISYRKRYGFLVSHYELSAIEGFTPEVVASLTPFITFDVSSDSVRSARTVLRNNLITRIKTTFPEAKGYRAISESKGAVYTGIPISVYNRYHLEIPRKLELGIITDHDAGEPFFRGSNRFGFDYYSGFVSFKGDKIIRQVTLGDFLLQVGQGVSFGGGSVLGKSGNTMGILKFGQTIRPYTSTDENRFFRGISAVLGKGPYKLVLFYSNKNRDANILIDRQTGGQYFTSLQTSGYHRTMSEIEDRRSINEQMTGGYGEIKFERFRIGALMAMQQFNLPMSTGSSPYKARSFAGKDNLNLGLDYQVAFPHLQCFGEAGISKNGKAGGVQGVVWHVNPQLSLSTYFRIFDPGFHAFYGSSLSEGSGNRNETGLYSGIMLSPFPKVKLFGYMDIYHFPMLTYSTVGPSSGNDYMIQAELGLTRKLFLYIRGKYESKPQKLTVSKGITADYDEMLTKLRFQAEYIVNEKLLLHTRFEYAGYHFNTICEKGFLVFQDIVYEPWRKLKLWFRYAWFNTEGYNSRIYSYENDLLYSFAIPEFHGNGQRIYLTLKWSPSTRITLYLKAGCTIHSGAASWGSGNDVTDGNQRTEIRGLLNWRF